MGSKLMVKGACKQDSEHFSCNTEVLAERKVFLTLSSLCSVVGVISGCSVKHLYLVKNLGQKT